MNPRNNSIIQESEMKLQELMKKKDKGKEIVVQEQCCSLDQDLSMFCSKQETAKNVEQNQFKKDDNGEKLNCSSSKITPCIFITANEKSRIRWSQELHEIFLNAVTKLGGSKKATPKNIKEMMGVEGLSLHHIKSHLQKLRLGKCNTDDVKNQTIKCSKIGQNETKTCVSSSFPRTEENIYPKFMTTVKQKKEKEVNGSLYMLIKHDVHFKRCRETQKMQMILDFENQLNMSKTQHFEREIHDLKPYEPQQLGTNMSQNVTFFKDIYNNNMDYSSSYNVPQQTQNKSSVYELQKVYNSSRYSNCEKFQLNHYLPLLTPPVIDFTRKDISDNTTPFESTTQPKQVCIPHQIHNSYPQYNNVEMVKTQINALQNSSNSQIQKIPSHETNLSPALINDFELDPVQVLEALGFGVMDSS